MTTDSAALAAVTARAADVRVWLYDAAAALDEWDDTTTAVVMRTAAEMLGSPAVVRRLRMEALVLNAHDVEHQGEGTR